jgi:uncharacterized RDD family membrane protein YckC
MNNQLLDESLLRSQDAPQLRLASSGKRFANYLIDVILAYLGIGVLMAFAIGGASDSEDPPAASGLLGFMPIIGLFSYYFLSEMLMKGRTVGKFITGTRAITDRHEYLTATNALVRTLCRLVPFDAFSFLFSSGYGWHDKWSSTMVVDEKEFQAAYGGM